MRGEDLAQLFRALDVEALTTMVILVCSDSKED